MFCDMLYSYITSKHGSYKSESSLNMYVICWLADFPFQTCKWIQNVIIIWYKPATTDKHTCLKGNMCCAI